MKRIVLLLVLVAGVAAGAWSQDGKNPLTFGVKAGLRFPHMRIEREGEQIFKDQSYMFGYLLGGEVLAHFPVLGLEVEGNALFSRKGVHYESTLGEGKSAKTLDVTQSLYYLDFPLKVNWEVGFANTGLFLGVGPTFSVGLLGNTNVTGATQRVEWGAAGGFDRFDVAMSAQVGLRYSGVQVSVFYDYGMVNIRHGDGLKMKNRMFGFTLAYMFF